MDSVDSNRRDMASHPKMLKTLSSKSFKSFSPKSQPKKENYNTADSNSSRRRSSLVRQNSNKSEEAYFLKGPSPVPGRQHMDIQTELYLEELTSKPVEFEVSTQTDEFLDRPPTPLFIPKKSGVDVETQIGEGDLFDFDLEIVPILETIVGKTLEQAFIEVLEENELMSIRKQQKAFEEKKNAELAEVLRLEAAERRRLEEKDRRIQEQMRLQKERHEAEEKIASKEFSKNYVKDVVPAVFDSLIEKGYFYDKVEREIETEFIPWLSKQVSVSIGKISLAQRLLDGIILNAVKERRK